MTNSLTRSSKQCVIGTFPKGVKPKPGSWVIHSVQTVNLARAAHGTSAESTEQYKSALTTSSGTSFTSNAPASSKVILLVMLALNAARRLACPSIHFLIVIALTYSDICCRLYGYEEAHNRLAAGRATGKAQETVRKDRRTDG